MNHRDKSVSGRDLSHARTDRFVRVGRARYVHCFARFLAVSNGLGVLASNCHTQTPARQPARAVAKAAGWFSIARRRPLES